LKAAAFALTCNPNFSSLYGSRKFTDFSSLPCKGLTLAEETKHRNVRVAMVKAVPVKADRESNWQTLQRLTAPLAKNNVDVVITPECFIDGYMVKNKNWSRDDLKDNAEPGESGEYVQRLKKLAADLKCYLVAGFSECVDGENIKNAAYLFDRNGQIVGKYYKIHTHHFYTRGDSLPVFHCDFGVVGILICADRRWPENSRILRLKGAEVILMPTYGMHHEENRMWMQTRSYENGMFICFAHPVQSLITSPSGKVEARLESNVEDVLVHDIDLNQVVPLKTDEANVASNHPIQNRYPELYEVLVER